MIAKGISNDITFDIFFNVETDILPSMPKLQQGPDGRYTITVPRDLVDSKQWHKGDELGFAIVDEINRPMPGDIFLRRNR